MSMLVWSSVINFPTFQLSADKATTHRSNQWEAIVCFFSIIHNVSCWQSHYWINHIHGKQSAAELHSKDQVSRGQIICQSGHFFVIWTNNHKKILLLTKKCTCSFSRHQKGKVYEHDKLTTHKKLKVLALPFTCFCLSLLSVEPGNTIILIWNSKLWTKKNQPRKLE